jgi:hypothetical protein
MSHLVHVAAEPAWLRALVDDVVIDAVEPLGFIGRLGYRWWEPSSPHNGFAGHQVVVYPTPSEIRGPGVADGCCAVAGFNLDVGKLLATMARVESVVWRSPVRYNGDLDGPELSVQGFFAGRHVLLRFFSRPPPDEPASHFVNPATGEATPRPSEG